MPREDGQVLEGASSYDRIISALERTVHGLVEESLQFDSGWVARTRSLPQVWTLNQVRITGAVDPNEILLLAEQYQNDLTFRHVVVQDDDSARAALGALSSAGWRYDRVVLMAMTAPPFGSSGDDPIVELSEDQMLHLMGQWLIEEHPGATPEGLAQVLEYNRREGALWNETRYGFVDPDGTPISVTKLRSLGTAAWVEDVYTAPTARGRGHARALIHAATSEPWVTGHDFVFICADDNDWPKNFYARAGFESVGYVHIFHLDAADQRD